MNAWGILNGLRLVNPVTWTQSGQIKLSLMAFTSTTNSESLTDFIPEFESLIAKVMEEWKVPGLAVAVVQNGEVTFVRPYGFRDAEAGLEVTADTQFQIMSVSKSFAATGLGLLVDERRMDWKKPV